MSHENASLRDPIFYQWHSYVNSVMHMYKNRLPSYQPEMVGQISFINLGTLRTFHDGISMYFRATFPCPGIASWYEIYPL